MIKAAALIALFRKALAEKWGYIWGKRGQVWTQKMQDNATRDATVRYGSKWIGRRVADCSGLFVWAYDELGHDIFHGSNTIFNKHTSKTGAVYGEVEILPGTAVFQVSNGRRTHIGLYVGDGKCIEARGTISGVIESDLDTWDEWGMLSAVDYTDMAPDVIITGIKTLRRGDSGLSVKDLQEQLIALGYDVGSKGADGIYGAKTEAAVQDFQRKNGLTADGIAGKLTMAALRKTDDDIEPEAPEDDEPVEEMSLEKKVDVLWEWMQSVKGGGVNG